MVVQQTFGGFGGFLRSLVDSEFRMGGHSPAMRLNRRDSTEFICRRTRAFPELVGPGCGCRRSQFDIQLISGLSLNATSEPFRFIASDIHICMPTSLGGGGVGNCTGLCVTLEDNRKAERKHSTAQETNDNVSETIIVHRIFKSTFFQFRDLFQS